MRDFGTIGGLVPEGYMLRHVHRLRIDESGNATFGWASDCEVFLSPCPAGLTEGDYVLFWVSASEIEEVDEGWGSYHFETRLYAGWSKRITKAEFEMLVPPEGR